jgi:hypothetical protein
MKPTRLTVVSLIVSVAVSFGAGYTAGSRHLSDCQAQNKILFDDLMRAVKRGIVVETNLILCEQSKEQKK